MQINYDMVKCAVFLLNEISDLSCNKEKNEQINNQIEDLKNQCVAINNIIVSVNKYISIITNKK